MPTFGSLFSGVGGFDVGFERAGMTCVRQVEIDPQCRKLLAERFPHASIGVDVREEHLGTVDVVCGGFPCQDLSVAGKRSGLAGERSGLWYEFHRILDESRPQWVVIENVPGLLSSNGGADFAIVLRGLVELGYGVAWRILDAQYFGVAQRRRRVFIVGSLGDGRASQVLFEPESLCRDTPPRREAGQRTAGTLGGGTGSRGWAIDTDRMTFVPTVSMARNAKVGTQLDAESETFVIQAGHTQSNGLGISACVAMTLESGGGVQGVAQPLRANRWGGSDSHGDEGNVVQSAMGVRRLTPTETERLQGFSDGWTTGFSDSTRYRMMGNAVCVPVAEWIGRRLMEVIDAAH